ncbi:oligosaccharide repeat unit polymerase [Jeotgalibacillus salarius]|uniref:Oligosaccharide repeat unit polymerase n=1 Tax=Jeotgalibacillus salarius TaxID=546023 RepID=A0A4Y8LNT0_9BACL|nr:oligosaccharide repeat unit polymerase [Jeotgalibacillus salarius]TFE04067.1 oligosaccharide repeat unit polymerase [Jeotgalibacillus salarius]
MKFRHALQELNKIDVFSPYLFFPFVVLLYFGTSLFDFGRFDYFGLTYSIVPVILSGLASYWLMVWVVRSKNWRFNITVPEKLKGKSIWLLFGLAWLGLIAYIIMIGSGQIGISDEAARRSLDPKLNFLSALLWYSGLFLISWFFLVKEKKVGIFILLFAVLAGLFVVMGYRTPLVIMLFTAIIIFHYMVRQIKFTWFIGALVIVGLAFSMFGFYRFATEDPDNPFNSRELPEISDELNVDQIEERNEMLRARMEETPAVIRALNNESVTGHVVLSKIMEYTDEEGHLLGEIHEGIFSPVLPGEQTSPRMRVSEIANSLTVEEGIYITRPGRTTTPTLFGQFFADFGYAGIIVGFGIIGLLITVLYNQMQQMGNRSYQAISYAFVLTVFTISLHTGLLDLIFVLMIGFALLSAMLERKYL